MSQFLMFAGLASMFLSTLAYLAYLRQMLDGTVLPLRSTWLIWTVLSSTSFLTNLSEGATTSLGFIGVQAVFTALIFLMSLRHGVGSPLRHGDRHVLALATFGLMLWLATENAVWALALVIGVSAMGGVVTIVKTWKHPQTETWGCWALLTVAAGLGLVSVGTWDPVLMAYPVYLMALRGSILIALWAGARNLRGRTTDSIPLLLLPRQRTDTAPASRAGNWRGRLHLP